ncbi:hypothetical protein Tco_1171111, partial [Tanacetum coccineum]
AVSLKKTTNPKKKTEKESQATEEPAAPKKATASSKKKLTKRKLVLRDKTNMSEEEVEHRPLSRKKRVSKTVVIQEPPSVPVKQTYESSRKHKGIEMLFDVAQFEIDTLKAQKASRHENRLQHYVGGSSEGIGSKPGVPDELTRKYAISDEGVGIQSEVPDETKSLSKSDDDSDKWGSTDEEVFHIVPRDENLKSPPSDTVDQNESEDDQNESEDDDDERVETDDDSDDDEEEDNRSSDTEMSDEKPKGDEQAIEAQPNYDNKDKFEFLQPTSSQSLSFGFANQFLLNSPNASLLGTINEPAEGNITSMMDVPIQQDVPTIVPKPLHVVTVSVIVEAIQAPPLPPLLPAVDKYLGSSLPDAFRNELQANNATLKKGLSELNYKEVIEESVKAHVVKEVKTFLPQFLPKAVSGFATPIIEESVKAHAMNEDVIEESVKSHVVNEVKNFLP